MTMYLKLNDMKKISYLLFVICLTLFVFYGGYKMSMEQVRVQMELLKCKEENGSLKNGQK